MVGYCPICGKPVYFGEKKRSLGRDYHPLCLKCQRCNRQLTAGQHAEYDEKPYCSYCYLKMFGPRGTAIHTHAHTYIVWHTHTHTISESLFAV
uniref:Cysteine-rich protein 1 n=1 Tax=Lates calcarifer TaxID=8187 RepID=A0A4W6E4J3_LATCA